MHILDQSIPYINLYILSPLTLFCFTEVFEPKSEKKSRQNALCIRDQICDKYILNKHAERCSYVFGHMEISLYFTPFFMSQFPYIKRFFSHFASNSSAK